MSWSRIDPVIEPVMGSKAISTRGVKKPEVHNSSRTRVCVECEKPLSMYNKGPHCYSHQPTTFPRIRGRLYR